MSTMLLTVPLKPGKIDRYKAFIQEFTVEKKANYADFLKRYGLINTRMWHHKIDGTDYMFWTHEATPKAKELIPGFATSTHEFDVWFKAQVADCAAGTPQSLEFLFEFNAVRG